MDTPKYSATIIVGGSGQSTQFSGAFPKPTGNDTDVIITRQSGELELTFVDSVGADFNITGLAGMDAFVVPFNSDITPVSLGAGVITGTNVYTVTWAKDTIPDSFATFSQDRQGAIVLYVELDETGDDYFQTFTRFNVNDGDFKGDAQTLPLLVFDYTWDTANSADWVKFDQGTPTNLTDAVTTLAQAGKTDWGIVINQTLITDPASPTNGDTYVIAGTGGLWSSYAINDIVRWNDTVWTNKTPIDGDEVYDAALGVRYRYNGAAWQSIVISLTNQDQLIYVSKVGNDSNNGFNIEASKLTIGSAITAAIALSPLESNQITIQIVDSGDYQGDITIPEWVHIFAPNAEIDGRTTISNNCVLTARRLQNTLASTQCIRKTDGGGLSLVTATLMIVASNQEGVRCFGGQIGLNIGTMAIDDGAGMVAQNGSRIVFDVQYVSMTNGSNLLQTNLAGITSNSLYGQCLRVEDDNTSTFLVADAVGDMIDVTAGSVAVLELYDLGTDTILNLYANTTTGTRTDGTNSQANVMDLSGVSNLQGDLTIEGTLTNTAVTANTAKVTNATHTGDVTGSGALTLASVAITGQSTVTADGADFLLISDTGDSGNLKKVLVSDIGGGGAGIAANWTFDTSTTASDPGAAGFRYNNATPASVTAVYVNVASNNTADFEVFISSLGSGDTIYIQQLDDDANFIVFNVTSSVDNTGWYTINGTIADSGTLPGNASNVGVNFGYTGAGAGASVTSVFGRTGAVVAVSGDYDASEITDLQKDVAAGNDNDQTGTAYTYVLTDQENTTVWMNNAAANEATVPTNASVAFPTGTKIGTMMEGAGVTTITGDTGVTVNGVSGGSVVINNRYQGATLTKRGTDTWIISGDVT